MNSVCSFVTSQQTTTSSVTAISTIHRIHHKSSILLLHFCNTSERYIVKMGRKFFVGGNFKMYKRPIVGAYKSAWMSLKAFTQAPDCFRENRDPICETDALLSGTGLSSPSKTSRTTCPLRNLVRFHPGSALSPLAVIPPSPSSNTNGIS